MRLQTPAWWFVGVALLLSPAGAAGPGDIVPNGVVYSGYVPGVGYGIDVIYNPANLFYTGFFLEDWSS
jgi:hypothetical protein